MYEGHWILRVDACETALADNWAGTWARLCAGDAGALARYAGLGLMSPTEVVPVPGWRREGAVDGEEFRAVCARLAKCARQEDGGAPVFLATNHGDADAMVLTEERAQHPPIGLAVGLRHAGVGDFRLVQSACSSGMSALVLAALAARDSGRSRSVIAMDTLADVEAIGFKVAGALSPTRARPFMDDADGLTIGEAGAAVTVSWLPKGARGDTSVALLGFGMSCDAHHATSPDPEGTEIERAWRQALASAGLSAEHVSAVYLHGTGTPANDYVEEKIYRRLWPGNGPAVCSLKWALGHTMGCAGVLNLLAARETAITGWVPPTIAAETKAAPRLPIGVGEPLQLSGAGYVLAVSSGFGGHNAAVVVGPSS